MNEPLLMLVDLTSCSGCHACAVACKAEHRPVPGTQRLRVQYVEQGAFPAVARTFIPTLCQHCADAPCIAACPVDAIGRAPDGTVSIDQAACVCSGPCVSACPYGAIALDLGAGAAAKCDWCADLRGRGERTACEATCPTEAILVAAADDPRVVAELARGGYTAWEPEPTAPRVRYRALEPGVADALAPINHE